MCLRCFHEAWEWTAEQTAAGPAGSVVSDDYERLEREHGPSSSARSPRDLTAVLEQREPLDRGSGRKCSRPSRRFAPLQAALARRAPRRSEHGCYVERGRRRRARVRATRAPNGRTCAVKYRHLGTGKRWAEPGSTFLRPTVLGNPLSTDWLVAEGETDGARLYELTAGRCAVLVMPAGAKTFRREWAGAIPRDAVVYLMLDARPPTGEEGARKAARVVGGRTVRVAPPRPATDWCEWDGDTDALRRPRGREARRRPPRACARSPKCSTAYGRSRAERRARARSGLGSVPSTPTSAASAPASYSASRPAPPSARPG